MAHRRFAEIQLMKHSNTSDSIRRLALDGILTAVLVFLGMIKLPSLIPGAEFQLSAPYAVCLAATVGFRRYLGIGICSSVIQLMLGTHTLWNVVTAMVFRIVAGGIAAKKPEAKAGILLAGPAGTGCARLVLSALLQTPALPLLAAAIPGMVFTAVSSLAFYPVFNRIIVRSGGNLCGERGTGGHHLYKGNYEEEL